MASTTGKLEKIHVFPSYNSFNKNISSVGSDDFAFVKTDLLDKLAGNTTPVSYTHLTLPTTERV